MPEISYPAAGRTAPGYLAIPSAGPGPWPGVVVIHEAFGLNDDIRKKADQFAARGYLALAPDLNDGKSWVRCVRSALGQLRAQSGPAFAVLEVPHDVKVYPGSGHRFLSEASGAAAVLAKVTRMSYQQADAADAWQRIFAFFGEHLSG
jgi:dienelactone hydrolase